VGGPDSWRLDPVLRDAIGVDRFWGRHLRARCCPCIIERFCFCYCLIYTAWTLIYRIWTLNCNILIMRPFEFQLVCMCACAFLLYQESFDMILVTNPSSQPILSDGGVTLLNHYFTISLIVLCIKFIWIDLIPWLHYLYFLDYPELPFGSCKSLVKAMRSYRYW
jgi:hypothetical protein